MKKRVVSVLIALVVLMSNVAFAASGQVEARIPDYDIYINDTQIDSSKADYPMLEYKGVTYFPMTWDYSSALGLTTSWNNDTGLSININGQSAQLTQSLNSTNEIGSTVQAKVADFAITINGDSIDNASEEFPVLNYNGITYFPLTWRFASEYLGIKTEWDDQTGLKIASIPKLLITAAPSISSEKETPYPFTLNYTGPEGWVEASKMITDDIVDIGAKVMDISEDQLALAMKTRVAEMAMYTKYPVSELHEDGNPNMVFMVERNYAFDAFQTVEEYMNVIDMQLSSFDGIELDEEISEFTNANDINFLIKRIYNTMTGIEIIQDYFITKVDSYFVVVIVSYPSSPTEELIDSISESLNTIHVE